MKPQPRGSSPADRPQKFLLYLSRAGSCWCGKAIRLKDSFEFRFKALDDLKKQLELETMEEDGRHEHHV